MTDHQNHNDAFDDLDALFAEARMTRPDPSEALMASILSAAAAEQAAWAAPKPAPVVVRRGPLAMLVAALGGWASVGGLAAASITGLVIGIAGPDAVLNAPGLSSFSTASVVSGEDYSAYEIFDLASIMAEDLQ